MELLSLFDMYRNQVEGNTGENKDMISGKTIILMGILYLFGISIFSFLIYAFISALAFLVFLFSSVVILSLFNYFIVLKISEFPF